MNKINYILLIGENNEVNFFSVKYDLEDRH